MGAESRLLLSRALRHLASRCDGAVSHDDQGFAAPDVSDGHRLARADHESWTLAEAQRAWEIVRRYSGQLAEVGISPATIPAPIPETQQVAAPAATNGHARRATRVVTVEQGVVVIAFPYDADLVAAVKSIPGRRFDSGHKHWTAPLSSLAAVRAFAEKHRFVVTESAANAPVTEAAAAPAPPSRTVRLDGDRLVVRFDYDADLVAQVRELAGARWDKTGRHWSVPVSSASVAALRRLGFVPTDPKALDAAVDGLARNEEASRAATSTLEVPGLGGTLRPFQAAGVAYAMKQRRLFIADEMGTGKTVQALATVQATNAYPALVVCPASLKLNWQREARKWLPGRSVAVLNGTMDLTADVCIINYDVLARRLDALKAVRWQAVVLDESHYIKSAKAQRTKAAQELCQAAPLRLLLSGTPLLNRPVELVTQLQALGRLDEFGGSWKFISRYCGATRTKYGVDMSGATNLDELHTLLRQRCLRGEVVVECEHGPLTIAEIVESELPVSVWSVAKDGCIELRRTVGYSKRHHQGALVRVRTEDGRSFDCTPDHRVWTSCGYKRAAALTGSDYVLVLWQTSCPPVARIANRPKVLLSEVRGQSGGTGPCKGPAYDGNQSTQSWPGCYEDMRVVWQDVHRAQCEATAATTLLQSVLLKCVETNTAACTEDVSSDVGGTQSQRQAIPGNQRGVERTPPQSGINRKGARYRTSKASASGPQRSHITLCTKTMRGARVAGTVVRVHVGDQKAPRQVHNRGSELPVSRLSKPAIQVSGRSRRYYSSSSQATATRCMEDESTSVVRVASIEVLQSAGDGRVDGSSCGGAVVYDIEVEGNHNFFANGVLVSNCYVRRTKAQVLAELPAKQRVAVPLELSNEAEYRRAERDVAGYLRDRAAEHAREDAVRDGADLFAAEARARAAGNRASSAAETAQQLVRIEALKRLAAEGKLRAAIGWAQDFLDAAEGEKLVLFAHHVDVQQRLYDAFPGAARLMAEDSVQERQANVDRFQTDPACRLIVCSLTAGGVGITLTAASNVAFLELAWTPASMSQAEDRVHRIGQRDAVTAWYLLAAGTIDEDIEALLEAKRAVVDAATDGTEAATGESILNDLIARLEAKNRE